MESFKDGRLSNCRPAGDRVGVFFGFSVSSAAGGGGDKFDCFRCSLFPASAKEEEPITLDDDSFASGGAGLLVLLVALLDFERVAADGDASTLSDASGLVEAFMDGSHVIEHGRSFSVFVVVVVVDDGFLLPLCGTVTSEDPTLWPFCLC